MPATDFVSNVDEIVQAARVDLETFIDNKVWAQHHEIVLLESAGAHVTIRDDGEHHIEVIYDGITFVHKCSSRAIQGHCCAEQPPL